MAATRQDDGAPKRAPDSRPPAVLAGGGDMRPRSGGLRAGFGLDWLMVRADGRPTETHGLPTLLTPDKDPRRA